MDLREGEIDHLFRPDLPINKRRSIHEELPLLPYLRPWGYLIQLAEDRIFEWKGKAIPKTS